MSKVSNERFTRCFVFKIRQVEFLSRLLYDLRNIVVMDMTDVREDMMFYLMVQTSGEPIDDSVLGAKVHCSEQLVNSPSVLHVSGLIW